jgi:predicted PurR-regulated permease PerM
MTAPTQARGEDGLFIRRTLIVIGLIALALLLWSLRDVLVLVFGAVVVATLFRALAAELQRLHLGYRLALSLSVLSVLGVIALGIWMFGAQLTSQTQSLGRAVPQALEAIQSRLAGIGLPIDLSQMRPQGIGSSLAANAGKFVMSLTGALTDILLLLVGGIFVAASPTFYKTGLIKLVPPGKRELTETALQDTGTALQLWLKGQLVAMLLIGVLTWLGLWLIGVPSALALGLIAGLLEFIPFVGPILSAIPAVLLAFTISPDLALWTVLLYVGIQHVEGYAIQPLIQSWAVDVPGAVLLFALLAAGGLFGPMGVIFAAPMTVVVYVLVKRLYVQEALDTATPIPGEDKASPS